MLKTVTIVGARPQFIKIALLRKHFIEAGFEDYLVHTGQHYDQNMSQAFFDQLDVPQPDMNLGIMSSGHGEQTGEMLIALERVLKEQRPDCVVVVGDTNSTLAGALAAAKLAIPIAHIEAGLRSFNWSMPEEINRVLVDRLSQLLFVPNQGSIVNLNKEGITEGIHDIGDVMLDVLRTFTATAKKTSSILDSLGLQEKGFVLATCHRQENTDDPQRLKGIFEGLGKSNKAIVMPLHPRTRKCLKQYAMDCPEDITMIDPVGYFDFLKLAMSAEVIATDSGGAQKEAYWLGVPCVTLRDDSEWVETIESGWNVLVGADSNAISGAIGRAYRPPVHKDLYGDGEACQKIVRILKDVFLNSKRSDS